MPQNLPNLQDLNFHLDPNTLSAMSPVVAVLLGIVVLLFGRSLFWAFIAIAGFLLGMALAHEWLADKPEWIQFLAAIGAGILGAILGILIERLAFAIAGFFAGGYLAIAVAAHLHAGGNPHIFWIVGGIIGAIVAAMLMDWAIVVLSSLAGAAAILTPFQTKLDDRTMPIAFLVLAIIGIVFQGRRLMLRRRLAPPVTSPPA
jgi:MFS family permease